jgi:hypothetical protein
VLLRDNRAIDVIWMGILQSEWRAA